MPVPVQTVRPLIDYLGGKNPTTGFTNTYNNVMAGQQSATEAAIQNRINTQASKQRAADAAAAQRSASAAAAAAKALQQRQAQAEAISQKQQAAQQAAQQAQIAKLQAQFKAASQHAAPVANQPGAVPVNIQPVGVDNGQGIQYAPGATAGGSTAIWGDPRSPGWAAHNLVTFKQGKISVTVNRQAATAFKGFLNALTKGGYHLSSVQGENIRNKRMGQGLSEHAFGTAIDINPSQNPNLGSSRLVTNLPTWVGALAARYGLIWGGTWQNTKDPMHFEYVAPSQRNGGMVRGGQGNYSKPAPARSATLGGRGTGALLARPPAPKPVARPAATQGHSRGSM